MSLLGDLFGYDRIGNDLIGVNLEPEWNCANCGISCTAHTPEMEAACLRKLCARPETAEGGKRDE
jgi:hypothetical protein